MFGPTRFDDIPAICLLASMLRDKNAHIICLLIGQKSILLARLTSLARIRSSLSLVSGLHFGSKPGNEFGATDIELLFADEIPHFVAPLFAILLGDYNPAVIVFAVFGHELFEG